MRTKLHLLICFFIFNSWYSIAQLYTNGSLVTGTVAADGFVAPAGYSWSEMQHNTGNSTQANATSGLPAYFYSDNSTSYALADDFTVPSGQTWEVTGFDFFCYQTVYSGSIPPIDQLRIRLYNVNPSTVGATPIAGNFTTNVYDATNSDNAFIYRIFHATVPTPQQPNYSRKVFRIRGNISATLPAGQYWVEFQAHATDNAQIFFPPVTVVGSRAVSGANSKINVIASTFPSDVLGWANNIDGGIPTNAPDVALALPFSVLGTTLGNAELSDESQIKVYPNPTSDSFFISNLSNPATIEITDLSGRQVLKQSYNSQGIAISDLQHGTYIVLIKSENRTTVVQLIKN